MKVFFWKVSLYKFLEAVNLIGIIFTLFFQKNGLDPFQISLLIGFWSATQLILEVPMGVVADKFPRRNVLIVAMGIVALGYMFWLKGGFLFYALGMIMWGVKNALTSGTYESFVYDELKSINKEESYGKVSGQIEGITQVGFMVSAALGGLLAQYSFSLVIIASIVSSLLAALVLFTTKSVKPFKSTGEAKYFSILKSAYKEIKANSTLLFIILFISLTFGVSGAADEFWPLIFNSIGGNTAIAGALMALEFGAFALAGYSFPLFEKLKIKSLSLILVIISGALFILFGLKHSFILLPLVFIASYCLKLSLVKFNADLQHQIGSEQRATVLSIKALTFEIIYLLSLLSFGFTSSKFGVVSTVYIWGAVIIFLTVTFGLKIKSLNFFRRPN